MPRLTCLHFNSRAGPQFRRFSGDIAPLHSCDDDLHSALPCALGNREAIGLPGQRVRSSKQLWTNHDRSRTLFDQRGTGAAGWHLAKFDLRASTVGQPSERGPGLPAVHRRDGDRRTHRKVDDEGQPLQGLRTLAHFGPDVSALLSVAHSR